MEKIKDLKHVVLKLFLIIIISIILEVILSNLTYINLLTSDVKDYVTSAEVVEDKILEIETNNIQIHNIKIYYEAENITNSIIEYTPELKVKGMIGSVRKLSTKYMVGNKNTKLNLNCENECISLKVDIENFYQFQAIKKIVINDTSIEFSVVRCVAIVVFLLILSILKNRVNIEYNEKSKKQMIVFYGIIMLFGIIIGILINVNFKHHDFVKKDFDKYTGEFLNAQVEAILNGRVSLLFEPPEELLSMSNPYDRTLRVRDGEYTDYSLYNGKFYSYFGLAPLIIMLPFKAITGYYLTNFGFSAIVFVALIFTLAKLYRMLIDRYVERVSYLNFILGFITIIVASTMTNWLRGEIYDITTECGTLFVSLTYIIILSIKKNPKKLYFKTVLCSIFMGLIVLSKPSFVAYYILLFFLLFSFRNELDKKQFYNCIKIFIIPIGLIAVLQMCWNYARFQSIFCFGAKYQLTLYDMKNLTYLSPMKIIRGLIEYLFKLPKIDFTQFPFVFWGDFMGEYAYNLLMFDVNVVGIFVAPISWIYITLRGIKKEDEISKELFKTIRILLISILCVLIITIRNGIATFYDVDVKIFMYLFAVIMFFKVLKDKSNTVAQKAFYAICITSIILILPISLTFGFDYFNNINTNLEVYLKNMFEFWT